MPLKLKDLSQYLNFAKKLVNASERIIKKTPSHRLKIDFKSDTRISSLYMSLLAGIIDP